MDEQDLERLYNLAGITHIDGVTEVDRSLGRLIRENGIEYELKRFISEFRKKEQGKGYQIRDREDRTYDSRDHTFTG